MKRERREVEQPGEKETNTCGEPPLCLHFKAHVYLQPPVKQELGS